MMLCYQYTALIDFASDGENRYAGAWDGRDGTPVYDIINQTSAIYVLLGGLQVDTDKPSVPTLPSPTDTGKKSEAIHGGVIGGVIGSVALALLAFTLLLFRHRYKGKKAESSNSAPQQNRHVPFGHIDQYEYRSDQLPREAKNGIAPGSATNSQDQLGSRNLQERSPPSNTLGHSVMIREGWHWDGNETPPMYESVQGH